MHSISTEITSSISLLFKKIRACCTKRTTRAQSASSTHGPGPAPHASESASSKSCGETTVAVVVTAAASGGGAPPPSPLLPVSLAPPEDADARNVRSTSGAAVIPGLAPRLRTVEWRSAAFRSSTATRTGCASAGVAAGGGSGVPKTPPPCFC